MKNRIVTISREFGSGGRTIGKMVAEGLNIPCYDSQLIQKIAQESGFTESYVKDAEEAAVSGFIESAFAPRVFGLTNEDYLWEAQRKVILELAEKESCVIVGRCADYILRDAADCLTAFVHASMEYRMERIVKVYGEREETPAQRLKDKDKRRAAYHRFYTNMKWGYAKNYHISLDSGRLGLEKMRRDLADAVLKAAKETGRKLLQKTLRPHVYVGLVFMQNVAAQNI